VVKVESSGSDATSAQITTAMASDSSFHPMLWNSSPEPLPAPLNHRSTRSPVLGVASAATGYRPGTLDVHGGGPMHAEVPVDALPHIGGRYPGQQLAE